MRIRLEKLHRLLESRRGLASALMILDHQNHLVLHCVELPQAVSVTARPPQGRQGPGPHRLKTARTSLIGGSPRFCCASTWWWSHAMGSLQQVWNRAFLLEIWLPWRPIPAARTGAPASSWFRSGIACPSKAFVVP